MPVPPLYIRLVQSGDLKKQIREVVDGQQRMKAVLDFIEGKYRISKSPKTPWSGLFYDDLDNEDQIRIDNAPFTVEVFSGISDEDVLVVFARLNIYSVKLNAQELRNGKYFGAFKESAYKMGVSCLAFWRKHRIFTEMNIARMLEAEFASELLIAAHSGMQDKKKSIDKFYQDFDSEYPNQTRDVKRCTRVMGEISETCDDLSDTAFNSRPNFYTLYCVVFHHLFGLPKQTADTPKRSLTSAEKRSLREAVEVLSDVLSESKKSPGRYAKYAKFIAACRQQTDNIKPRQVRFDTLFDLAF